MVQRGLVAAEEDPWELYDLRTDRAESHNLAQEKPNVCEELAAAWNRKLQEITRLATKAAP